jgi:hypothetical protein
MNVKSSRVSCAARRTRADRRLEAAPSRRDAKKARDRRMAAAIAEVTRGTGRAFMKRSGTPS